MKRSLIFSNILPGRATPLFGQAVPNVDPLALSGYVETYYIKDFNDPPDDRRPGFVYSDNRADEASINMGSPKARTHSHPIAQSQ